MATKRIPKAEATRGAPRGNKLHLAGLGPGAAVPIG